MRSPSKNAFEKITTESPSVLARTGATVPLALSRPNEKYGAVAAAADSNSRPLSSTFSRFELDRGMIFLSVLIGDMTRGILFPTMWLFVLSLGGNKVSQGLAIASFSMGRVIFSPVFGGLSETYGHKRVLIICNVIITVGTLIYSSATSLSMVALGQFVMGCGSASLGVTRSYIAEHSQKRDRTASLAMLTSVQYFGFSATPIFGAVIAAVGKRNRTMIPFLPFLVNEFSLPAIFVGCIAASNAALLYSLYSEKTRSNIYEEVSSAGDLNDSKNESSGLSDGRSAVVADEGHVSAGMEVPLHSHFNAVAATRIVVGGCLMNVAMKGTIGVFETLSSEFVTVMYHWDSLRTGYTFALFGALGVLCLLSFPLLQQFKVQDINLITTGSILMTSSCLILFAGSHRIPLFQFYMAIFFMYVLGYPLGHTALLGAVSKVYGNRPQGFIMGYFAASGSFARILFPLLAGFVAEKFGNSAVFGLMAIILLFSTFCLIFFRDFISKVIE